MDKSQKQEQSRALMIVHTLPDEDDPDFDRLSEWEQGFLDSMRVWAEKNQFFTDAMREKLEQLWEKLNQ